MPGQTVPSRKVAAENFLRPFPKLNADEASFDPGADVLGNRVPMAVTPQQLDRLVSGAVAPKGPTCWLWKKKAFQECPGRASPSGTTSTHSSCPLLWDCKLSSNPSGAIRSPSACSAETAILPLALATWSTRFVSVLYLRRQRRIEALGFQNGCAQSQCDGERLATWDWL